MIKWTCWLRANFVNNSKIFPVVLSLGLGSLFCENPTPAPLGWSEQHIISEYGTPKVEIDIKKSRFLPDTLYSRDLWVSRFWGNLLPLICLSADAWIIDTVFEKLTYDKLLIYGSHLREGHLEGGSVEETRIYILKNKTVGFSRSFLRVPYYEREYCDQECNRLVTMKSLQGLLDPYPSLKQEAVKTFDKSRVKLIKDLINMATNNPSLKMVLDSNLQVSKKNLLRTGNNFFMWEKDKVLYLAILDPMVKTGYSFTERPVIWFGVLLSEAIGTK